ncbi:hypothetical protein [Catellatospora methionotrophica]|uniref:hypothetical protein n=1 Tax=Catellatospora methionotrophica TaxID=121620 RepID=UPI0033CE531C
MTDYTSGLTHGDFVTRVGAAMESAPFEIHFPRPAQSDIFRVNDWKTTTNFNIAPDTKAEDTVFRSGRQRAGAVRPNGIMTLDVDSHESIDSDSMDRIDNDKLSVRYAKFDVPSAVPPPTAFADHVYEPSAATLTAVADWHDRVCVTVWQDVDHDSTVGDGEYEYLILVFPGTPGT